LTGEKTKDGSLKKAFSGIERLGINHESQKGADILRNKLENAEHSALASARVRPHLI
jgi:hypothetical protein